MIEQLQFICVSPDQFLAQIKETVKECLANQTNTENQQKDLLTRKETEQILSVSATTLYNWEKSGLLIPKRLGHRV